jgi:AAA+ superfamily predicted ATPase
VNGEKEFDATKSPEDALLAIHGIADRAIFVMRDFHVFLSHDGTMERERILRQVRDTCRFLGRTSGAESKAIIFLGAELTLPLELESDVHVMEWPNPDRAELESVVHHIVKGLTDPAVKKAVEAVPAVELVNAALGLNLEEAYGAFRRSLRSKKTLDPKTVLEEKKQLLLRSQKGALIWMDPVPGGLDAVGELDNIKQYVRESREAFSDEARTWSPPVPFPQGVFMYGIPGGGKTYLARCVATDWNLPPLRLNIGALFGSLVGESERNLREVIKLIKLLMPCVLLIDEIDKALGGGNSINETDNRVKGELLTAFQEWEGMPIFKMATANNMEMLVQTSPELIRDERWDDRFFFDLPTLAGRREIAAVTAHALGFKLPGGDLEEVALLTPKYTGAEIKAAMKAAVRRSFTERNPIGVKHILDQIREKKPLAETAKERINFMRDWTKGRARYASRQPDPGTPGSVDERQVEL